MLAADLTGRLALPPAALSPPLSLPQRPRLAASARVQPAWLVARGQGSVGLRAARDAGSEQGKGVEPEIADGEGAEFSMGEVSAKTGGGSGGTASPTVRSDSGSGKGVEPEIADGEGSEFSMSEVSAKTGGDSGGNAPTSASRSSQATPPQDGHYHVTEADVDAADVASDPKVNASWECLEEPEALSASASASPSAAQPAPHMPMYRGEPPKEGEGYLEPGQDIASALPGRWGDCEDFWEDGRDAA